MENKQPEQKSPESHPIQTPDGQQTSKGTSEDTKTIVTVLLLLFIYPIGLILVWFWVKWPRWVKIIISLPIIIILLALVLIPIFVFISR